MTAVQARAAWDAVSIAQYGAPDADARWVCPTSRQPHPACIADRVLSLKNKPRQKADLGGWACRSRGEPSSPTPLDLAERRLYLRPVSARPPLLLTVGP